MTGQMGLFTDASAAADGERERILKAAYGLFARRGTRAIQIVDVAAASKLVEADVYCHFPTTDALIAAVLRRRDQHWVSWILDFKSRLRGRTPEEQLLAIFDVMHDWLMDVDNCNCSSPIRVMIQMVLTYDADEGGRACLAGIRAMIHQRASDAGLKNATAFVESFILLLLGAVIAGPKEDFHAAQRAREMARTLMAQHR